VVEEAGVLPSSDPLAPLPHVPVGGRLTHFADEWVNVTSDPWVLQTVTTGYRIEFTGYPRLSRVPRWTPVPRAEDQRRCLEDHIQELLAKSAVRLIDPQPSDLAFYSTLFMVTKKGGGGGQY